MSHASGGQMLELTESSPWLTKRKLAKRTSSIRRLGRGEGYDLLSLGEVRIICS